MPSDTLIYAAVGGFAGSVLALVATIITSALNNRSARQRHLREIAVQAGLEAHRHQLELLKATQKSGHMYPAEYFIFYNVKVAEILDMLPTSTAKLKRRLTELAELETVLHDHVWKISSERRDRNQTRKIPDVDA